MTLLTGAIVFRNGIREWRRLDVPNYAGEEIQRTCCGVCFLRNLRFCCLNLRIVKFNVYSTASCRRKLSK